MKNSPRTDAVSRHRQPIPVMALTLALCTTVSASELTHGPHLQLAPTQLTVHWETQTAEDSLVVVGLEPDRLTMRFLLEELTTEHSVTVTGLAPATRYYYSFGSTTVTHGGADEAHAAMTPSRPPMAVDPALPDDLQGRFTVKLGTVSDELLGLMWTASDNGAPIDWKGAVAYCDALELAGHDDWRLPTVDELEQLYDERFPGSTCDQYICRLPAGFALSRPWFWSASRPNASRAVTFAFFEGRRYADLIEDDGSYRALCVRNR